MLHPQCVHRIMQYESKSSATVLLKSVRSIGSSMPVARGGKRRGVGRGPIADVAGSEDPRGYNLPYAIFSAPKLTSCCNVRALSLHLCFKTLEGRIFRQPSVMLTRGILSLHYCFTCDQPRRFCGPHPSILFHVQCAHTVTIVYAQSLHKTLMVF
jgi:hypothetical protein